MTVLEASGSFISVVPLTIESGIENEESEGGHGVSGHKR